MATHRICKVDGCDKPISDRRDMCGSHYGRWKRHGDPLAGRVLEGEPDRYFRDVVLAYVGDDCLIWPYSRGARGYGRLYQKGSMCLVSRLVCAETEGPAPTPEHEAAHSCGKGHLGCVSPKHVRWATSAENKADKILHGTHMFGENHPSAIIPDVIVAEVMALKGKMTQQAIADKFGISRQHVGNLHNHVRRAPQVRP